MSSPLLLSSCFLAGAAAAVFVIKLAWSSKLDAIPTVGTSRWFGSWGAGFDFPARIATIQEGYDKYKSAPFKIADKYNWTVVVSSREHVEELRRAPDDELSFGESINYQLNTRYLLGDDIHDNPRHTPAIRSQLNRNIGTLYPDIRDEIVTAFEEVLDLSGNEWKSVFPFDIIQSVICRTNSRVFVGPPLCRNRDWIDLNMLSSLNITYAASVIGLFPEFIRPLVVWFFKAIDQDIMRGEKLLGPIIEERQRHLNECGHNWTEMPNDLFTWLLEEGKDSQMTVKAFTTQMLFVNFIALHTTSVSFTHAIFYLAANPQYIQPLREEIEAVIEKEGWSKAALVKLRKVDSFLRECQRIEGMAAMSVMRKAMKDFTFSDGTFIPKGTMVGVATRCVHHDKRFYEDPDVFKPFRFAEIQEEDEDGGKYQFASTGMEFQPFGHGKHACPGRFYVATETKTMLAHIVTTYDIKLEGGGPRPPSVHIGEAIGPNPCAKIMFRRRVD